MIHPPSKRAGDRGEHHHDDEVAHVLAALAGRHDLAERRHGADHQPARSQALDSAEGDQLRHGSRQAGQRRPRQEDDDRDDEELLPPVHVAELAVERRGDRGRQHVGGDHPRQVRDAAKVTDDPRQRRAHDELVEHGQHHRDQQAGQDDHDLPVAKREGAGLAVRYGRRTATGPVGRLAGLAGQGCSPVASLTLYSSTPRAVVEHSLDPKLTCRPAS